MDMDEDDSLSRDSQDIAIGRVNQFVRDCDSANLCDEDSLMGAPGDSYSATASDNDEEEEAGDILGEMGLTKEQLVEIDRCKKEGMFVSAWEEDETGVEAKNLSDPNEQFLTAAEEGKEEMVHRLLTLNPHFVHVKDKDAYTPLHRAAYNNHLGVVRILLENGADPEARTSEGWTVLHSASAWGNYEIVGALLSHGVDVNALSNGHLHALHLALTSQEDKEKVFHTVRYLLQAPGVDAGVLSGAGDSPLAIARRSNARLFEIISAHLEKI